MGIIVNGQELPGPDGLVVRNFKTDASVFRFKNATRDEKRVESVVLHETVTRSSKATVDVLKQRGLGVHFIVDPDGTVFQHADLLLDKMWHATTFNGSSVGIEVVNPYEPRFMPKGGPWTRTIVAPWAAGIGHPIRYVLPTKEQAEATCRLTDWLSSAAADPLTIPQLWPGFQGSRLLPFGRVPGYSPAPGIHAHMYFGNMDGAWLVLYCWLRLEPGLGPDEAYDTALELAEGVAVGFVNLERYFAANPYMTT